MIKGLIEKGFRKFNNVEDGKIKLNEVNSEIMNLEDDAHLKELGEIGKGEDYEGDFLKKKAEEFAEEYF